MRVLYVQYTNPGAYPPLVRGATLLAESGAEVRMLGTRVRDTDALDVSPSKGIDVRLMNEAPRRLAPQGPLRPLRNLGRA